MDCPLCRVPLRQTDCHGVRVDECPQCLGDWFDRDELRRAKDSTDADLRWLDFDAFESAVGEAAGPSAGGRSRLCPRCGVAMGVVAYEDSGVTVDKCGSCHGVWLDHDEFKKIIKHLEHRVNAESAAQLRGEAVHELAEVFTGPEGPLSEARDLFTVLRLLRKRIAVEHPGLSEAIDQLYSANPFK